jgi:hypothetical protein
MAENVSRRGLEGKEKEESGRQDGQMMRPATTNTQSQSAYPNAAQKATLVDKIKEMLPGSQTDQAQSDHSKPNEAETQTAYPDAAQKATLLGKVKDLLPESQTETKAQTAHSKPNQTETQTQTQTQTGYPNAAQKATLVHKVEGMFTGGQTETDTETAQSNPNQKAGLVDKIKENIPQAQNKE